MMEIQRSILVLLLLVASACKPANPSIETFQLMGTSWDDMLLSEFQREAAFHNNVDYKFNIAASPQEEAKQIEQAIEHGVDAIIVNPYCVKCILPVIEKAYDTGIPVVLVGQKLPTFKYTAYVGMNNKQVGAEAARYIKQCLPEGGNIIEIEGYRDAPFYLDRSESFRHVIDSYPEIRTVARFDAAWNMERAHAGLDSLKALLGDTKVDLIFGYGDEMVRGAMESMNYPDAIFVGSDGIPGEALQSILNGTLDATLYTPAGGDVAISTAVNILRGRSFVKNNILEPTLVTGDNAKMVEATLNTLAEKNNRIDILINDVKTEHAKYANTNILVVISVVLLFLVVIFRISTFKLKESIDDLKTDNNVMKAQYDGLIIQKEILEELTRHLESEKDVLLEAATTRNAPEQPKDAIADAVFMRRFRESVEKHIDNAELSVDDIATELGVSRAQLFRKVRAEADSTPNELIQSMRLKKAETMLATTDLTISEISYAVGFTSPSYFSKCYKDMFGIAPSGKRG